MTPRSWRFLFLLIVFAASQFPLFSYGQTVQHKPPKVVLACEGKNASVPDDIKKLVGQDFYCCSTINRKSCRKQILSQIDILKQKCQGQ